VCDGPGNYLGNLYRAMPVAITVEGANILTRNLIIFGQGAIRCHPYLLEEMFAVEDADEERGIERFDRVIYKHLAFAAGNFGRAAWHGMTLGRFAPRPGAAGAAVPCYRQLGRYSAALAFVAEVALVHLGGALKRKEMISARLGDVLSELYLLSCVLKRFHCDGQPGEDLPLVTWCCESGFATIERSFDEVFRNYPSRALAALMRLVVLPFGVRHRGPADVLSRRCADLLMAPGAARDRLTNGVHLGAAGSGAGLVENAFRLVTGCEGMRRRMSEADVDDPDRALRAGIINEEEHRSLQTAQQAVADAVAVDDFDPQTLSPLDQQIEEEPSTHTLKAGGSS
jgi:acyl-CoA dehydrogenase